mmetsp:Transcript_12234/g.12318  ORF Transcript_12234/g.12318 Transcript_12234/m.12318 type:complete len:375 (+) Transcript_12234:296-1420(+)
MIEMFLRLGYPSFSYCTENKIEVLKSTAEYLPSKDRFYVKSRENPNLSIMYDIRTRNPRWVMEVLSSCKSDSSADRKKLKFFKEKSITVQDFQVAPGEFTGSGYSRGHLAPAADFSSSQQAMESTFSMSNVCPQMSGLNQGLWAQLEAWVRRLLFEYEEVVVITGPVFLPVSIQGQWVYIYPTVGSFPRLVSVPTHFFKVILVRGRKRHLKRDPDVFAVAAFLVPNQNIDTKTPLLSFLVKLRELENIVGLRFFDDLLSEDYRRYLDSRVSEMLIDKVVTISPEDGPLLLLSSASPSCSQTDTKTLKDIDHSGQKIRSVEQGLPVTTVASIQSDKEVVEKRLRAYTPVFGNPSYKHLCDDTVCSLAYGRKNEIG